MTRSVVLVAAENVSMRWALAQEFDPAFLVLEACSAREALRAFDLPCKPVAVVTSLHLGEHLGSGLVLLQEVRARAPHCTGILVSDSLNSVRPWMDGFYGLSESWVHGHALLALQTAIAAPTDCVDRAPLDEISPRRCQTPQSSPSRCGFVVGIP
jgi:hypothetical protein